MTRHEFLYALHRLLNPRGYLEIGVQYGTSLRLASCPAVGIDPDPLVTLPLPTNARVVKATSDDYFAAKREPFPFDLAFIDGMHLFEYALRDFMNVERWSRAGTVVVFDDVLPRNQGEASRTFTGGDWTGDVWKVIPILQRYRPDLTLTLVDTDPTGTLVVTGLDRSNTVLAERYETALAEWMAAETVPGWVLDRETAVSAEDALAAVKA